ncbi:MAG: hypothetical protein HY962_02725 [Ignavibacteriae bacterium]|nr:hypothetical protein [Ignavibacteriota bacterium]
MKRYTLVLFLWLVLTPQWVHAQESSRTFGIGFSGFVKTDFFMDTRQTVSSREGHFLLLPAAENMDARGEDINGAPSFNFLSIQTRLTGAITAPDAFGAKTSGVIEADFFGNENAAFVDANGFRLRHAYAKLSWENEELLVGQYWHPLFIPKCFSDVISFNTGAPFQPFSRNPQLRYTHTHAPMLFTFAASAQRDFTSPGGSTAQRNAALPALHALAQFEEADAASKRALLAGIGGGYTTIRPLLFTEKGANKFAADETVGAMSATAYFLWRNKDVAFKVQGLYGENTFDLTMLGGYGVASVTDSARNSVVYTPLTTVSAWSECIWYLESLQLALWGGYTQNLGAADRVLTFSNKSGGTDVTTRGADIASMWRLSPRIVYTSGKMSFALETEYTVAAYATRDAAGVLQRDEKGVVTASKDVANLRVLFAATLRF